MRQIVKITPPPEFRLLQFPLSSHFMYDIKQIIMISRNMQGRDKSSMSTDDFEEEYNEV